MRLLISFLISLVVSFVLSFFLVVQFPGQFTSDEANLQYKDTFKSEMSFWPLAKNYLMADFGYSWVSPQKKVSEFVKTAVTFSLGFQLVAIFVTLIFSVVLSYFILSSARWGPWLEKLIFLGTTTPTLFLAPVFIFFLSYQWKWLSLRYDETYLSLILPLICLTIRPICFGVQILADSWKNSIHQDYFRTARAKGLSFSKALWFHGFKNSALTFITQMVQLTGHILTGSILIETLFSLPGLGFLFVESLRDRDLPLLMGLLFLFCGIFLVTQFSLGWIHRYFEPRTAN